MTNLTTGHVTPEEVKRAKDTILNSFIFEFDSKEKVLAERMSKKEYDTNFRLDLMAKDLEYAEREASRAGVDLETAVTARQRFRQADRAGYGERDLAAVVEAIAPK